ncbi:MAG TPA: DUF507 family protein [Candidatus Methanoperedens sp.]|nr:DUF507 family protein [Candidatus Methanoperedens sp.]
MRLRQEEIDYISWKILRRLQEDGIIDIMGEEEPVAERLRHALSENLAAEDQLNREVDDILRGHLREIQRDSVDYRRMFQMVKTKLARERNLVI